MQSLGKLQKKNLSKKIDNKVLKKTVNTRYKVDIDTRGCAINQD